MLYFQNSVFIRLDISNDSKVQRRLAIDLKGVEKIVEAGNIVESKLSDTDSNDDDDDHDNDGGTVATTMEQGCRRG